MAVKNSKYSHRRQRGTIFNMPRIAELLQITILGVEDLPIVPQENALVKALSYLSYNTPPNLGSLKIYQMFSVGGENMPCDEPWPPLQ